MGVYYRHCFGTAVAPGSSRARASFLAGKEVWEYSDIRAFEAWVLYVSVTTRAILVALERIVSAYE